MGEIKMGLCVCVFLESRWSENGSEVVSAALRSTFHFQLDLYFRDNREETSNETYKPFQLLNTVAPSEQSSEAHSISFYKYQKPKDCGLVEYLLSKTRH